MIVYVYGKDYGCEGFQLYGVSITERDAQIWEAGESSNVYYEVDTNAIPGESLKSLRQISILKARAEKEAKDGQA